MNRNEKTIFMEMELSELGWELKDTILNDKRLVKRIGVKKGNERLLKIIPKRLIFSDRTLRTAVNREIQIANKVKGNFNFLAGFYDFFYTKSFAVFVYEHYEMGTIRKVFGKLKMSLLEITVLMRDLFNGLEELKHLKIVHKNLHEDVIYVSNNTLKIGGYEYCELNDSKRMEEFDHNYLLTVLERNLPTVPPEVIFNRLCGVKTPLYSFGVIFFKFVHGKYPNDLPTVQDMKNLFISKDKDFKISPKLPPEFTFILKNALEATYEYRISPYELKSELNYLYSFCKKNEDELRGNIYGKRQIIIPKGTIRFEGDEFDQNIYYN